MTRDNNGITDPVNHELDINEFNSSQFDNFLDVLTDVPASVPLRPFTIDRAGIVNQEVNVNIKSLFSDDYVTLLCRVSMQVELEGHRGIHMSRCEETLFQLVEENHETLEDFAEKFAAEIQKRQASNAAYVRVEGQYLAKRKTHKTKLTSYDKMILTVNTRIHKEEISTQVGLKVFNITGCPCTETYTKFSIVPELKKQGFSLEQINAIVKTTNSGTHTQRGIASIAIDKNNEDVTHRALYSILDQSCHLIFELLKRPDEHDLVLRALRKPQFTEDVVREIVSNTLDYFEKAPDDTQICATSLLYDSIHIHDVYTKIDKTLGELRKQI